MEGQKLKNDGDSFRLKLNTQELFDDWARKVGVIKVVRFVLVFLCHHYHHMACSRCFRASSSLQAAAATIRSLVADHSYVALISPANGWRTDKGM